MAAWRVAAIRINTSSRAGGASDHDLAVLERVGRSCPVAQSLHPELEQELAFHFECC